MVILSQTLSVEMEAQNPAAALAGETRLGGNFRENLALASR